MNGLYLIRHGHTKMNSTTPSRDLIRGWKDVPLDEEGKREAKATVSFIQHQLKPVKIFSSDLERAANIAKEAAAACECPLKITKDLRPWGLGSFQGEPAAEVVPRLQKYIDEPEKPVPGGGETFNQFRGRVLQAVKRILEVQQHVGDNIVLLTHFRVLKLVQSWLAHGKGDDIDAKVFAANDIPTGGMLKVYRDRGKWKSKVEFNPKIGVKRTDPPRAAS